jgi:anhydro-N-acetylmuramic acid kinase
VKLGTDFIASHGHTVFHQPENGFTFQLGDGQTLAIAANLPVVYDFRSKDVSLGGQGAPLVPIGDELLFPEYDACLNIGGIANISFREAGQRKAFDICPANQLLNNICRELGIDFDENGKISRKGSLDSHLLETMGLDNYYLLPHPKSLSNEYVAEHFLSVINNSTLQSSNKLHTVTEHIALKISEAINRIRANNVLVTGGGAHNNYLIERLIDKTEARLHVPDAMLVDYREALIFAFLGVLRWRSEINCLASVTGAKHDSSGGVVCYP